MRTRATRDGDGWLLRGTKRWITNAGEGDVYVVFAVTEPERRGWHISAFVVQSSDAGVSFGVPERKLADCDASSLGRVVGLLARLAYYPDCIRLADLTRHLDATDRVGCPYMFRWVITCARREVQSWTPVTSSTLMS